MVHRYVHISESYFFTFSAKNLNSIISKKYYYIIHRLLIMVLPMKGGHVNYEPNVQIV